jgi:ATP-dependent DNA helicase RecG
MTMSCVRKDAAVDEQTLQRLIADGESNTVEFKIKAPRPAELAERMCGMANTRTGGMIIFGVEDATRTPVGVAEPSDTVDIALRAARMLKPPLPITDSTIQITTLDTRKLVIMHIPANLGTLYQYTGAFLVRRGTHTVALALDEINAYLNAYGAGRWEIGVAPRAMLEDIDTVAVERHLAFRAERSRERQRYVEPADLLLSLEAAARDLQSSALRPTNAGLLMFGYDPQLHLPQSEVVCIKYADTIGVRSYLDRRNLRGTLPELINQTSLFLKQFIRVGATIRGFFREDEPEYPHEALREAVVNAIVHRDYSRLGETVRVFMYDDRVEVRSPGGLLPGISLADLVAMRVRSVPRNPVLAGYLRDRPGYMERIGSGIRFMVSEMRRMDLPDPEFTDHQDFVVTFRNGDRVAEHPGLNERQRMGLRIVHEQGSISTPEYCAVTGAPERTGLRDLQSLVAKGLLVVRGKKRGQRFYLP